MTCLRSFSGILMVCLLSSSNLVLSQSDQAELSDHVLEAIGDLRSFVAIPNFGLHHASIQKNIDWLREQLVQRGFDCHQLETTSNPLLFAERIFTSDLPTILFYMHLDGQAIDPSKWNQSDPYQAVLKKQDTLGNWITISWQELNEQIDPDWRIFGRSTADDKAPIIAFLQAIDWINDSEKAITCNIKMIIDAEEELGSQGLPGAVAAYGELLAADALVINDGPVHLSGQPTLTFGCRGIMTLNLTIYGPASPQHSGHYGNYAPNPVFRMAHLLASMKDQKGRVLIDGYYDGVFLSAETRQILGAVPDDEDAIKHLLQIAHPDQVGSNYQESLQYPSLNVRGTASGWVGAQARTIVPDYATVAMDIRLVPESDPDRLYALIREHTESQGYLIVDHEPTPAERRSYPKIAFIRKERSTLPFRTDMSSPVGTWLERALTKEFEQNPIKIRIMGGTVPISSFIRAMDIPAVILPMVNADNNQHSPNENMRIGHLANAIRTFQAVLTTPMD
ncbi:MAG: M20/M25/M40 family metallo-hydrolase [Saprospiraceae bacterium]|nr:M20/M25/M40 family metallo-hydrolase [Saprospiraceae bacterium]